MTLDDLGKGLESVGHPRRRLVVGDQHRGDIGLAPQEVVKVLGISGLTPGKRVAGDIGAKGRREVSEAIAERADRHRQDALTGRDKIGDRALHATGPGGRKDQHLVLGLERPPQPSLELRKQCPELGTTMVDHRGIHGLQNASRDRCGTRNS